VLPLFLPFPCSDGARKHSGRGRDQRQSKDAGTTLPHLHRGRRGSSCWIQVLPFLHGFLQGGTEVAEQLELELPAAARRSGRAGCWRSMSTAASSLSTVGVLQQRERREGVRPSQRPLPCYAPPLPGAVEAEWLHLPGPLPLPHRGPTVELPIPRRRAPPPPSLLVPSRGTSVLQLPTSPRRRSRGVAVGSPEAACRRGGGTLEAVASSGADQGGTQRRWGVNRARRPLGASLLSPLWRRRLESSSEQHSPLHRAPLLLVLRRRRAPASLPRAPTVPSESVGAREEVACARPAPAPVGAPISLRIQRKLEGGKWSGFSRSRPHGKPKNVIPLLHGLRTVRVSFNKKLRIKVKR
jgi:hypothetical protein